MHLITLDSNAKVNPIHTNVCSQGYDKFTMVQRELRQVYSLSNAGQQQVLHVDDAPNGESMFARFSLNIGVANITKHLSMMRPRYQKTQPGRLGFAELVDFVLPTQSI